MVPSRVIPCVLFVLAAAAQAPAATIRGHVCKPDGSAVPGVEVTLAQAGTGAAVSKTAKTAEDGSFAFDGLPAGLFHLFVHGRTDEQGASYRQAGEIAVSLTADQTLDVPFLYVRADLTFRGRVALGDQKAPEGTRVYWRLRDGVFVGPALTMADGYFSLRMEGWTELRKGPERFRVILPSGQTFWRKADVEPGDLALLPLATVMAPVEGRVQLHDGTPVAGATVAYVPDGEGDRIAFSDPVSTGPDGSFSLGLLTGGSWRVYAYRSAGEWVSQKVVLEECRTQRLTLTFPDVGRHSARHHLELAVRDVPLHRYLGALYRKGGVPDAFARMNKLYCLLYARKEWEAGAPLPPPLACWDYDEKVTEFAFRELPIGTYELLVVQGIVPRHRFADLARLRPSGPSGVQTVVLSHAGFHPFPKMCAEDMAFSSMTLEVKPGSRGNTYILSPDWTSLLPNQRLYPLGKWMSAYYESIFKDLEGK